MGSPKIRLILTLCEIHPRPLKRAPWPNATIETHGAWSQPLYENPGVVPIVLTLAINIKRNKQTNKYVAYSVGFHEQAPSLQFKRLNRVYKHKLCWTILIYYVRRRPKVNNIVLQGILKYFLTFGTFFFTAPCNGLPRCCRALCSQSNFECVDVANPLMTPIVYFIEIQ